MNSKRLENGGLRIDFTNLDGQQFHVVTFVEPLDEQVISNGPTYGLFGFERRSGNGNGHGVLRPGDDNYRDRPTGADGSADGVVELFDDVREGQ